MGERVGSGLEAGDEAGVDGCGGLAVELLVDDGFGEGLEGGLLGGEAEGEGADAGDESGELGVGGGERGGGGDGVVGELAGGAGGGRGMRRMIGAGVRALVCGRERMGERVGDGWSMSAGR